ncbi:Zinc finger protein 778, partial [Stegodyphus mimosarum]
MQVSKNLGPSLCELCSKLFSLKRGLNQQLLTATNEELYPCEACRESFKEKVNLQDYSQIYTGKNPHSCGICGIFCRDKQYLQKHLLVHTADEPLTYGKPHSDKESMKSLIRKQSDEKFYKCDYKCEACNKFFKIKLCFDKHMKFHTGVAPNVCTICGRAFIRKNSLTLHLRTHTNENKKTYTCEICNESFGKRSLLINHIQCNHIKEKLHLCKRCGKLFKERQDLTEHLFSIHG